MRILIISPSRARGGAEEYLLTISSGLKGQGHEVWAAFPRTEGTASLIHDCNVRSVRFAQLSTFEDCGGSFWNIAALFLNCFRTIWVLLKIRPDVVEIIRTFPFKCLGGVLTCAILNVPAMVLFVSWPDCNISLSKWKTVAYSWIRSRRQLWGAVSQNTRGKICETFRVPLKETFQVGNGIKTGVESLAFDDRHNARIQMRKKHGFSEKDLLFLTVARLEIGKGCWDLFEIIPKVLSQFPNLKFAWIGSGSQASSLAERIVETGLEGNFFLPGYSNDVYGWLISADFFLFPSHFDEHPFALLEAMASGLPIIASDAGGIPEILKSKAHGLLFTAGKAGALLDALEWALTHTAEMRQMAECARTHVKHFSEERMIRETLRMLCVLGRMDEN